MASITAIELGADTCALAHTSERDGVVQLFAAETLDPSSFAGTESFTVAVSNARRAYKFPRRARVVLWGLPDGARRKDPAIQPLLAPLTNAGFKVSRVVTPSNALAALARVRAPRGDGAVCWLAINRAGVAIVVVRPGKQLYERSFVWDSNVGASGSQARLLQRYSLVSFLAPEVKRAIAEVRKQGAQVEALVTCGNLPDLRSLTMPLIEELDLEVETLDSLDGLIVTPAIAERVAEQAAAIRLACAATLARGTRALDESRRRAAHRTSALLRVAALLLVTAGIGFAWYTMHAAPPAATTKQAPMVTAPSPRPTPGVVATSGPAPAKPPVVQPSAPVPQRTIPSQAASTPTDAPGVSAAVTQTKPPVTAEAKPPVSAQTRPPVAVESKPPVAVQANRPIPADAKPPVSAQTRPPVTPEAKPPVSAAAKPPVIAAAKPPVIAPAKPPVVAQAPPASPRASVPSTPRPQAGQEPPPAARVQPLVTAPVPNVLKPQGPPNEIAQAPPLTPAPLFAPVRPQQSSRPGADKAQANSAATAKLLKDPMPRVTAILVSNDRRLATINDGQIVGVGDMLGPRTVVAIEERAVVLREPSGVQIRVGLGGRLLGVSRQQ